MNPWVKHFIAARIGRPGIKGFYNYFKARPARMMAILLLVTGLTGSFAAAQTNQFARDTASQSPSTNSSPSGSHLVQNASSQMPDFSEFRIVLDRNIFATRRSGATRARTGAVTQPRRVEYFMLVGTMEYGDKKIAFFDGSVTTYRRAVKIGDTFAGFKLAEVSYKSVKLQSETNEIELFIGWQLRREEGDSWNLIQYPSTVADSQRRTQLEPLGSNATFTSKPGNSGDSSMASDVLRRLMERREQELQ